MEDFERKNIQQQIDTKTKEISDLNLQINNMKQQIKDLKDKETAHQKLKEDIENKIIPNLNSAKTSLSTAKTNLTKNYSGSTKATSMEKTIQDNMDDIKGIKDYLKDKVIPAINSKLNEIKSQIKTIEGQINNNTTLIKQKQGAIQEANVRLSQG